MSAFETRVRPAIVSADGSIDAYTVEFSRDGKTHVAVTLHERSEQPDTLVSKAEAVMREVLEGEEAREPEQPEGPDFSSNQTEPELDDAPIIRVRGEGMIRPD